MSDPDRIRHARWTRRAFLQGAACAAAIATTGHLRAAEPAKPAVPSPAPAPTPPGGTTTSAASAPAQAAAAKSRVVLIRHPDAVGTDGMPRGEVLARMADEGVMALTGEATPDAAWGRFVAPGDTLGIKTNVWRYLGTPPDLERTMVARARAAGVAADRIAVDDRGVLDNPVFRQSTALWNIRPMRTHHWAGVGSCIKNYIMFSPDPPSWHPDSCANLAGVWDLPIVRGKTRLNILVMLTPLFHSQGPHDYNARYTWPYRGLLMSTDPVAVDATGLRILEARRREYFKEDQPFAVSPKHIRVAAEKYRLGVADPGKITLVRLGLEEGSLI